MKVYLNGLVGYSYTGVVEYHRYGSDTKENIESISKTQPQWWYYHTHNVTYHMNDNGHRCVDYDKLSDDYLLFLGCSYTTGDAVELEHTFPYIVSKQLDVDYYNLGLGSSGIDMVTYNLMTWLKINKKPKYVVIQWPQPTRTFRFASQYNKVQLPSIFEDDDIFCLGPWLLKFNDKIFTKELYDKLMHSKQGQEIIKNYKSVISTDAIYHDEFMFKYAVKSMLELLNIPLIEIDDITTSDYGRDCMHPGILTHKQIASEILGKIS